MLLRQYKRIRSVKPKNFSYKDIKTVYLIILYEKMDYKPIETHLDAWLTFLSNLPQYRKGDEYVFRRTSYTRPEHSKIYD